MSIIFKCRTRTICTHPLLNFTLISSISSAVYGCHLHIRQNFLFQPNVDGDSQIWIFGSFLLRHENKDLSFFFLLPFWIAVAFSRILCYATGIHTLYYFQEIGKYGSAKLLLITFSWGWKYSRHSIENCISPLLANLNNGYWAKCLWLELVFMKS